MSSHRADPVNRLLEYTGRVDNSADADQKQYRARHSFGYCEADEWSGHGVSMIGKAVATRE